MRLIAATLIVCFLAGCSKPTPPEPDDLWARAAVQPAMTITPIADTYLATGYYHGAEPGNGTLHNNGICPPLFVGSNCGRLSQSYCRSLIAWDVSEIPAEFDSAHLQLVTCDAYDTLKTVVTVFHNVEHDSDSLIDLMGANCAWPPLVTPEMNWPCIAYQVYGDSVAWNSPGCGTGDVTDSVFASFGCDTIGTYLVDVTALVRYWKDNEQDRGVMRLSPQYYGAVGMWMKEFHSMNHPGYPAPEISVWY